MITCPHTSLARRSESENKKKRKQPDYLLRKNTKLKTDLELARMGENHASVRVQSGIQVIKLNLVLKVRVQERWIIHQLMSRTWYHENSVTM